MEKIYKNKKSLINPFSIGVILFIFLLLFVSFYDTGDNYSTTQSKSSFFQSKDYSQQDEIDETKIFKLEKTYVGQEKTISESSQFLELGSIEKFNVLFEEGSFNLKSSVFSSNSYYVELYPDYIGDIDSILIYFEPQYITGKEQLLEVNINDLRFVQSTLNARNSPIKIKFDQILKNLDILKITVAIKGVDYFSATNVKMDNFRILEKRINEKTKTKSFNFQTNLESLDEMDLELSIRCKTKTDYGYIDVLINNKSLTTVMPNCNLGEEIITIPVPTDILDGDKNKLTFQTNSFFQITYNLKSKYSASSNIYRFTINNFNDFLDIVMYGNFDKDIIDLRINAKTISLKRDEVISIFQYLKIGVNQINIITKPVEIEEFVIEKVDYYERD